MSNTINSCLRFHSSYLLTHISITKFYGDYVKMQISGDKVFFLRDKILLYFCAKFLKHLWQQFI
jgi:hypothetical protein